MMYYWIVPFLVTKDWKGNQTFGIRTVWAHNTAHAEALVTDVLHTDYPNSISIDLSSAVKLDSDATCEIARVYRII